MTNATRKIRVGDLVEVKSEEEILATMGVDGTCGGLPFMPEMRKFCGKRFRVFKLAYKVCVEEDNYIGIKRMRDAVLLEEVRCDGRAHDGCQRMCMIFWKEQHLKLVPTDLPADSPVDLSTQGLCEPATAIDTTKTYSCQSTMIRQATEHMSGWDIRQFVRDLTSRSLTPLELIKVLLFAVYNKIARTTGVTEFGAVLGEDRRTPAISLNLQVGELVEVKTRSEIAATLDWMGRNRGLQIGYEMLRHCGRRFRVLKRVDRMILETTGKMRPINNTVLLQGTACSGICARGCVRNSHPMWREAWLRRVV